MNYLDNSEVRSYGLGSLLSSGLSSLGSAASSIGTGLAKAGSTALSSLGNMGSALYKGADTVLGGLLPGAVAPSAGWLGQGGLGILGTPGVTGHQFPGIGTGSGAPAGGGFMGGLGNLYGGVDKVLGGLLPNIGGYGVTPSQGWLGSMYGKADNALGGYLPGGNPPGFNKDPFAWGTQPGEGFDKFGNQVMKLPGGVPAQSGGGFLDRLGRYAEAGSNAMDIYNLTQAPRPTDNTTGYNQAVQNTTRVIQPGVQGTPVRQGTSVVTTAPAFIDPAAVSASGVAIPSTPGALQELQGEIADLKKQLNAGGAGSAGENKTKRGSEDTLKGYTRTTSMSN